MIKNNSSCCKVSDTGICPYCKSKEIIKNGFTKNSKQQYFCKSCNKRSIDYYSYLSYMVSDQLIIQLTKEGLGIRSTARVLGISTTTLLKRIIAIANSIPQPIISKGKTYEVDEMRSFIKRKDKLIWIVYALERESKKVVSFHIGSRTNKTLQVVLTTLKLSGAKTIYTDGLKKYHYLIKKSIHKVIRFATNHIERNNLSLRTHIKRLNRRTICFSKSSILLKCILTIYFWK